MVNNNSVLLFKGKEENNDEYQIQFEKYNYSLQFIPVLDSTSESISFIQELLSKPPVHGSVIFTSQRSVDTWRQAIQPSSHNTIHSQWRSLRLFIVGSKTAEKVIALDFFNHAPIVHERAVQLAPEMIPIIQQLENKSVLFLAGDKRLNELPTRLKEADISYQEVRTYCTCPHAELTQRLNEQTIQEGKKQEEWAVFFSPSGVNYVLERNHAFLESIPKLAAIGETTADHMIKCGLKVTLISPKPRATELAIALASYDGIL
ncbi:tetrapyrrole biosynthesis, uroporphyrinogen III synthase [Circinella umbellata]|nr:tetrapyrrole biosynthesis, uroporphyrinogen III synthase [Circinella umbellata]